MSESDWKYDKRHKGLYHCLLFCQCHAGQHYLLANDALWTYSLFLTIGGLKTVDNPEPWKHWLLWYPWISIIFGNLIFRQDIKPKLAWNTLYIHNMNDNADKFWVMLKFWPVLTNNYKRCSMMYIPSAF
jgi:hypothetical protein